MSHSYQPRQTDRTDFVAVLAKVCLVTFLTSLGIVVLYPLFWMALNGFKTNAEIFGNPFALPTGFSLTNYIAAWNQGIRNYIATSVIVTLGSAFCTVLVSAWTAYGLTRSKLPGKPFFVGIVLGGLMLSPTVAVIPLVMFVSDRKKMGKFAVPASVSWLAWLVAMLIVALNLKLLYDTLMGFG